jgi:hypothetical protein
MSRGSAFYLHVLSDSTPRLSVSLASVSVYFLCRSSCSSTCLRLLPLLHPLGPPSQQLASVQSSPPSHPVPRTRWGSGSSLARYQYPSLFVFASGVRGPLQYTHVYRRRLPLLSPSSSPVRSSSSSVVLFGSLCPR